MSRAVSHAQARNIVAGAVHAGTIARPLNCFMTIHWETGSAAGGPWPTTRFIKLAGDWLALHGVPRVWTWVREAGEGKGDHVHILMHVPPELVSAFAVRRKGWLKACGVIYRPKVLKSRRVGYNYSVVVPGPDYAYWYRGELIKIVEYILKGAEAKIAKAMGLNRPREFEGDVTGKRTATSESIGATARSRWSVQHSDSPAANGARIEQIAAIVHPGRYS